MYIAHINADIIYTAYSHTHTHYKRAPASQPVLVDDGKLLCGTNRRSGELTNRKRADERKESTEGKTTMQ